MGPSLVSGSTSKKFRIRCLLEMKGETFIEYNAERNKVYEGGYSGNAEMGFVREGRGVEFNRLTVVYDGGWPNGNRVVPMLQPMFVQEKPLNDWKGRKKLGKRRLPIQGWKRSRCVMFWGFFGEVILLITVVAIVIFSSNKKIPSIFQSCETLQSISSKTAEAITLLRLMKGVECEEVDLSRFVNCEYIVIDDDAMTTVTRVVLTNLNALKSVLIGDRSCGSLRYVDTGRGSFDQLTFVEVGSNAMNGLQNIQSNLLTNLETVEIGSHSLNALLSVNTSALTSLFSLSVGASSLNQLTSFPMSSMKSLRILQIGSSSFLSVNQLTLAGMDSLETIRIDDDNWSGVTTVQVSDVNTRVLEAFGFPSNTSFSIDQRFKLKNIRTLVISDDAFCKLHQFDLDGVQTLETVRIGAGSFCGNDTGSFRVWNCPNLRTVTVGSTSFPSFGSVEFRNLTSLETVSLRSTSFQHAASFVLTASAIRKLEIGDHCFEEAAELLLTDLEGLESVAIGSFFGADDLDQGEGLCRIQNCSRLQSVSIGSHSFMGYSTLEIRDNPLLNATQIGRWCFASAQTVVIEGTASFRSVS